MSYIKRRALSNKTVSSVVYSDMHGVDFSGDGSEISRHRFSYLENMYRDYDGDGAGAIESIPGYRLIASLNLTPRGLFTYRTANGEEMLVIHASDKIFRLPVNDIDCADKEPVYLCNAQDRESRAFRVGGELFILDGDGIIRISDTFCGKIGDTGGGIYVPTTYINGKEHEQRNLLTRVFYEKTVLGDAHTHAFGTDEIKYSVISAEEKTCRAVGLFDPDVKEIYVPSRTRIGDTYYSVTEIGTKAFANATKATVCRIAEGIRRVGNLAFWKCTSLESVILPDSILAVGDAAFSDCTSLSELHLGANLTSLGANVISMCGALKSVSYAKDSQAFSKIEGTSYLGDRTVEYETEKRSVSVGIDVFSPAVSITSVKTDGASLPFCTYDSDSVIKKIRIDCEDAADMNGRTVLIEGVLSSDPKDYANGHAGFLSSRFIADSDVCNVIGKCRIAESFDGRIFLTGNPEYPGVTFFSSIDSTGENNPLYFGELNYFCDGVGGFDNVALLATADSLAVFKEQNDGEGSIYYHTAHDTGIDLIPKIYPVTYVHSGIMAFGDVKSFFDDPVFITECGLCAIDKKQINLERSIAVRSHNVNPKLLTEDLRAARLTVWRGYLVISVGGRMYLADSRDTFRHSTGSIEYEWYYLTGIGNTRGGERVYRYSPYASDGFFAHADTDGYARGTVYSSKRGEKLVYYTAEDGIYYEVYPTEEYTGGTFYPAKLVCTVGERLFFLSEDGSLSVFNNDMRAKLPKSIEELYGDEEERAAYISALGRRIDPYYYSFGNRAPRYALVTAKDNCGIPHLEKDTVMGSLTLKCRSISSAVIRCEVGTDKEGYCEICRFPGMNFSFTDVNFSALTFSTTDTYTVPVSEKSKGWVEKQISLYSDGFRAPFGVFTLAYRFTVRGKIKKNR